MNRSKKMRQTSAKRVVASALGSLLLTGCGLFLSEEDRLKRAIEAEQQGDWRAASIDLKGVLEKNPNSAAARFHLGVVLLAQGDTAAATRELERARDGGYAADALAQPLAQAYFLQGRSEDALQVVDARLQAGQGSAPTQPMRVALLRLRGEILGNLQRYAESKEAFEAALQLAPTDVPTLLSLAQLTAITDGPAAAIAVTDRALAAAPRDSAVLRSRGALFLADGKYESAIEAFTAAAAVQNVPKNDVLLALGGLAQAQLATNQVKDALTTTDRMQQLGADSPVTRYMRAYALVQDGQLDPARLLLEQNVVNEADVRSRILLGAVNLAQGKLNQAEMYLASAVAQAPDNSAARQLLAETRLRQAKPGDALEALGSAVEGEGADANLLALAARASIASGQAAKGVGYLQRNSAENPDNLDAKLDLAAGYLAAGSPDKALAELEKESTTTSAAPSEAQELRREYLAVLARINKSDAAGAAAHATRVADAQPQRASLQALASSVYAMQGQYSLARKYADAVVKLRPDSAASYVAIGRIELLQSKPAEAAANFKVALEKQPGNPTAAQALAMIELAGRRTKAAIEVIDSALKHNPNHVDLRILKSQTLASSGDLEAAEKLARETLVGAETHAPALALLGRVLSVQGKHREAIETFTKATRAAPESVILRQQLAVAHRAAGNSEQALGALNDALRIDAKYLPARAMAAQIELAKGDTSAATAHIEELLKLAPDQSSSHALLGDLRLAQKRFADAAAAFKRAGEIAPSPLVAVREYQARKAGQMDDPLVPLQKHLRAFPDDPIALLAVAEHQQVSGDRAAAIATYEKVVTVQPKNAAALNNLAWMRFEDGHQDALTLAKRAYDAAPQSMEIADTYAWVLINSAQAPAGLKLLEPIVTAQNAPRKPTAEIVAHYAVALAKSGREADARRVAQDIPAEQRDAFDAKLKAELAPLLRAKS